MDGDLERPGLSPRLLTYVFNAIGGLLQALPQGSANLPDSVKYEAFACLELLCREWWKGWLSITASPSLSTSLPKAARDALQMWRQLLILGAVSLDPGGSVSSAPSNGQRPTTQSVETSGMVLKLLHTLLVPRRETAQEAKSQPKSSGKGTKVWQEWDGESDLPIYEEKESEEIKSTAHSDPTHSIIYPTPMHLKQAAQSAIRSPLLHALTAALEFLMTAPSHSSTIAGRATALEVVRIIVRWWLAGDRCDTKTVASNIAPVLPGVVSKIVHILTTTSAQGSRKDSTTIQPVDVPAELVARVLALLGDTIVPVLSDKAVVSSSAVSADTTPQQISENPTLETLFRSLDTQGGRSEMEAFPAAAKSTSKSTLTIKETMQNLTHAVHRLNGLPLPNSPRERRGSISSHPRPAAIHAVIAFAENFLTQCAKTISWFEKLESSETILPLSETLLQWLLDSSHTSGSNAKASKAENAAYEALINVCKSSPYYVGQLQPYGSQCLRDLCKALSTHRSEWTGLLARRLAVMFSLASETVLSTSGISMALVGPQAIQDWGTGLISSISLSSDANMATEQASPDDPYALPFWRMQQIELPAAKGLSVMLRNCGRLLGRICHEQVARKCEQNVSDVKKRTQDHSIEDALKPVRWFMGRARFYHALSLSQSDDNEQASEFLQKAIAALFLSREVLTGIAEQLEDAKLALIPGKMGRRLREIATILAKEILSLVLEDWEAEAQRLAEDTTPSRFIRSSQGEESLPREQSEQLLPLSGESDQTIELGHSRGLQFVEGGDEHSRPKGFGPALDLAFVDAATVSNRGQKSLTYRSNTNIADATRRFQALQLDLLSISARLLGSNFHKHLTKVIYPAVSALTQVSPVISQAANRTLSSAAYSCGYTDVLLLVRDNVDYVLGEASWRLVVGLGKELESLTTGSQGERRMQSEDRSRSSSFLARTSYSSHRQGAADDLPLLSARTPPAVLTEVMRMLGPQSLHLIEDSIDEVLEALDRYHVFEDVADSLLGVLDRLLDVMRQDIKRKSARSSDALPENASEAAQARDNPPSHKPDPQSDADRLDQWLLRRRNGELIKPVAEDVSAAFDQVETNANADDTKATGSLAPPTPAARSQSLLVTILTKSLPFLSHHNSAIRARVLRLFSAGAELLAPVSDGVDKGLRREADLLPIINRAWPFILARLGWSANFALPKIYSTAGGKGSSSNAGASEFETPVFLEALKLVETLARHVPDFLAKRIIQEAWPRIKLILIAQKHQESNGGLNSTRQDPPTFKLHSASRMSIKAPQSNGVIISSAEPSVTKIRPFNPHGPLHHLSIAAMRCIANLMKQEGPSFPQSELWDVATFQIFLESMDARQSEPLRRGAIDMYRAMLRCDGGGTTWSILRLALSDHAVRSVSTQETQHASEKLLLGLLLVDMELSAAQVLPTSL